ncbi:hypothetical protein [Salinispora fenicalii]|uniref:hypothetical protein n=1 Tax=Salinispora fenicalii TaxID=1137263 RepID=UPI0004BCBC98|nr:hypothetical protein [Salinispora fenicalii]
MDDPSVVVERGVLTATAEVWQLAARRAEVIGRLADGEGSHRRETWERQITFLKDVGVPAGFLPDGAELDLQFPAGQPATVAGRR